MTPEARGILATQLASVAVEDGALGGMARRATANGLGHGQISGREEALWGGRTAAREAKVDDPASSDLN